jgi:hypothetical protein
MSNIVRKRRKSVETVDDNTTIEYTWTEEMTREEYEAQKNEYMHPKLLKKYKKEAPELLEERLSSASEENERRFWHLVNKNKSKASVKREITHLYRIKIGKKEFFWYGEQLRSTDELGNPIDHYHTIGKYEDPQFIYQLGPKGRKVATSIGGYETVYELNWPKDFTQDMESNLTDNTQFYAKTNHNGIGGRRSYGIGKYEDWKERTFDELVTIGKYGTLEPAMIEVEKNRQERKRLNKKLTQ